MAGCVERAAPRCVAIGDRVTYLVLLLQAVVMVAVLSTLVPRTYHLMRYRRIPNGLGAMRLSTWMKSVGITLVTAYAMATRLWPDLPTDAPWLAPCIWALLAVGAIKVARLYYGVISRHERVVIEQHYQEGQGP